MKIKLMTLLALVFFISTAFLFVQNAQLREAIEEPKVTGIGGVFFKSENPKTLKEWYSKNFGFEIDQYGSMFRYRELDRPDTIAYLQWAPFAKSTKYFQPSEKEFMINYTVNNMEELVQKLEGNGIEMVDTIATYSYGKFVHLMDPEGNKIELWEPMNPGF